MVAQDLWLRAGGVPVLRDLNFELRRGEILAVIGPSGCGKSTLMRHLTGLERPERGRVFLLGQDLHAGSAGQQGELRRQQGVMFQAGALWSSWTLGENLMLPLRMFGGLNAAQARERAREQLARVGLLEASIACRLNFRAACESVRPWLARWCSTLLSCCSTSRARVWIP